MIHLDRWRFSKHHQPWLQVQVCPGHRHKHRHGHGHGHHRLSKRLQFNSGRTEETHSSFVFNTDSQLHLYFLLANYLITLLLLLLLKQIFSQFPEPNQ